VRRVNSFASEPAGYCQYLLAGIGLAVFRFFPPPVIRQAPWKAHLPSLAMAGAYLVAYLLSFSLFGVIGLIVALLSHNIILKRINFKTLVLILIIGGSVISTLDYFTEGLFVTKIATMAQILPDEAKEKETENDFAGSSLILAMHLDVTLAGLRQNPILGWGVGGHPEAVERELPAWVWNITRIKEINATDAASLALRLLSEMGLLGFLIFTGTFALIIWQAVRAIQGAMGHPAAWEVLPICTGITVASISMVLFSLARSPSFFNISFWFLLALTSVVPEVLKLEKVLESTVPLSRMPGASLS
jgi:O-antigen ligase